jgi:hypothetical protein
MATSQSDAPDLQQAFLGLGRGDPGQGPDLTGDALELAEEVELGLLAGVAPLGIEQPLRQLEEKRGRASVLAGAAG